MHVRVPNFFSDPPRLCVRLCTVTRVLFGIYIEAETMREKLPKARASFVDGMWGGQVQLCRGQDTADTGLGSLGWIHSAPPGSVNRKPHLRVLHPSSHISKQPILAMVCPPCLLLHPTYHAEVLAARSASSPGRTQSTRVHSSKGSLSDKS